MLKLIILVADTNFPYTGMNGPSDYKKISFPKSCLEIPKGFGIGKLTEKEY